MVILYKIERRKYENMKRRVVEVSIGVGIWKRVEMKDIKHGDVFRMFDNGVRYKNCVDETVFKADGDAYWHKDLDNYVVDLADNFDGDGYEDDEESELCHECLNPQFACICEEE